MDRVWLSHSFKSKTSREEQRVIRSLYVVRASGASSISPPPPLNPEYRPTHMQRESDALHRSQALLKIESGNTNFCASSKQHFRSILRSPCRVTPLIWPLRELTEFENILWQAILLATAVAAVATSTVAASPASSRPSAHNWYFRWSRWSLSG